MRTKKKVWTVQWIFFEKFTAVLICGLQEIRQPWKKSETWNSLIETNIMSIASSVIAKSCHRETSSSSAVGKTEMTGDLAEVRLKLWLIENDLGASFEETLRSVVEEKEVFRPELIDKNGKFGTFPRVLLAEWVRPSDRDAKLKNNKDFECGVVQMKKNLSIYDVSIESSRVEFWIGISKSRRAHNVVFRTFLQIRIVFVECNFRETAEMLAKFWVAKLWGGETLFVDTGCPICQIGWEDCIWVFPGDEVCWDDERCSKIWMRTKGKERVSKFWPKHAQDVSGNNSSAQGVRTGWNLLILDWGLAAAYKVDLESRCCRCLRSNCWLATFGLRLILSWSCHNSVGWWSNWTICCWIRKRRKNKTSQGMREASWDQDAVAKGISLVFFPQFVLPVNCFFSAFKIELYYLRVKLGFFGNQLKGSHLEEKPWLRFHFCTVNVNMF